MGDDVVQLAGDAHPFPRAVCSSSAPATSCRAAPCAVASARARQARPGLAAEEIVALLGESAVPFVAILAVLVISDEYRTGMIRVTLAAMPRRVTVLTAKAAVVSAVVLAAGTVAVLGSLLIGRLILPGHGFTAAHGYPVLSLGDGPVLRAAAGSVLYLGLIALLGLGVATRIRDSATAIGVVLGLLYLFPIIAQAVSSAHWQGHFDQIGPMSAGLTIQDTTGLRGLPISPWAGFGVLAAWAAVALVAGGLRLRLRDV